MDDKKLKTLADNQAPKPSSARRKAALDAANLAFDAIEAEKIQTQTQGSSEPGRLTSIVTTFKRMFSMDMRIPAGASIVVVGLLFVPLAWQLSQQTALTPIDSLPKSIIAPKPVAGLEKTDLAAG